MKRTRVLLAATALVAASALTALAQPYARGGFNDWGTAQMTDDMDGSWSYTTTGNTAGDFHAWKIDTVGDWSTAFPVNDARAKYDANGDFTFHWYPGVINDGWNPQANRVGYTDPGNMSWEIMGEFNNWDSSIDTAARQMTPQGGGLYSVDYTITNAPGTYGFKFRASSLSEAEWAYAYGPDGGNTGDNAFVTTTATNQVVTFQLDVLNGRWLAGDPTPAPTNQVTFQVNMEVPITQGIQNPTAPGIFRPGVDTLYVRGDFNGWSSGPDYELTRVGSTMVYTGTVDVVAYDNSTILYKYYGTPMPGEEAPALLCGDSRTLDITNSTLTAPLVYWADRQLSDPTNQVTFMVDMSIQEALGFFDPINNDVYVRGSFNGWLDGFLDPAWRLDPVGSTLVYSNTFEIVEPAGANGCSKSYKFFGDANPGYESINNREFTITNSVMSLGVVYFNDLADFCPLVTETNWITFSVDMEDAVGYTGSPVFSNQNVYINGNFLDWKSQTTDADWGPNPKPELMLTNVAPSEVYSIRLPIPPGEDIRVVYKYSISGEDNEAGFDVNHVRYIRTTPGETDYVMPLDAWTGTNEMNIANLVEDELRVSATDAGGGMIQLEYWGVPCAALQSAPAVDGPWNTLGDAVDVGSTNVDTTVLDQEYFRLFKP